MVKVFSLIIIGYVLKQSWWHWFFGDTLQFIVFTCPKLCDKLSSQKVFDSLDDLEVNAFEAKLEDLIIYMKC
jgi:hypothetical protein